MSLDEWLPMRNDASNSRAFRIECCHSTDCPTYDRGQNFFRTSNDPKKVDRYKQLLVDADLIFGIDELSGKQSIVFGRQSLEELVRCGQSNILGIVNIGLDPETMDLKKLASVVQEIKAYHDCYGVEIK